MQIKKKYDVDAPYDKGLIQARGIEDSHSFLHPTVKNLQSPFELDNMKAAVEKVKEKVYGRTLLVIDCDCDGYCSSSILYQYLRLAYPSWEIEVIQHKNKGHGLADIAKEVELSEYELVLLPDAGTNDDEYFRQNESVQFIVLDHHLRTEEGELPTNVIVVNNQMSQGYVNKSLSGGGVTWQFCRAFDELSDLNYAEQFMDLAAVSIVADVMDITTLENRYIIENGLKTISNAFIQMLIDNAFNLTDVTPMGIAFYVVPYINAMTRVGTMPEKERLWLAFIEPTAQVECFKRGVPKGTLTDVAIESMRECTNVKAKQKRIQEKMAELCNKSIVENNLLENKIIVIQLTEEFDDIPPELNGLTATKIANETGHPTIIARLNKEGFLRGSARGLSTIDMPGLKTFFEESGLFEYCAGHELAFGLSLPIRSLDAFLEWADGQLADIDLNDKTWYVDFICEAGDDELRYVISDMDKLKSLWGTQFPEPLIAVRDIRINRGDIQVLGKNADTVKITHDGVAYMFFKRSEEEVKRLTAYGEAKLEVVGKGNVNVYYNTMTPQIFVEDYTIEDDTYSF